MFSSFSAPNVGASTGLKFDAPTVMMAFLVIVCAAFPLDLPQLVFAAFGAVSYAFLQLTVPTSPSAKKQSPPPAKRSNALARITSPASVEGNKFGDGRRQTNKQVYVAPRPSTQSAGPNTVRTKGRDLPSSIEPSRARQESARPAVAPAFNSIGFDAQMDEMLGQLIPTAESERVVGQLANVMQNAVQQLIPEAVFSGVASGNIVAGVAFGVAVPEVDIVAIISPEVLASRLQVCVTDKALSEDTAPAKVEARKMQKAAIRACTDRLVASGVCKFRRSAFRGYDPKVTLLAPATLGICDQSVPVDFSVNSAIPLYNAAVLTEIGRIDPRARALALVVRRWAKDRGICHAAKGHLSPYAWTLLVVYFLQVRGSHREGPLLPPLRDFARATAKLSMASLAAAVEPMVWPASQSNDGQQVSIGELFVSFVKFYSFEMDWRRETAAVLLGRRNVPPLETEVRMVRHQDGSAALTVSPVIWDPFEGNRNIAAETTLEGVNRLQEELTRAFSMVTRGASLTDLLEPWRPAE